MEVTKEKIGSNVLDAISNGTVEGLKLAVNVASMLLVFIAFIAMANFLLVKFGVLTGINGFIENVSDGQFKEFSLQVILRICFCSVHVDVGSLFRRHYSSWKANRRKSNYD